MHDLLRSETPSRRAGLRDGVKSCHEIDAAASAVAGTIGPLRISGNEARILNLGPLKPYLSWSRVRGSRACVSRRSELCSERFIPLSTKRIASYTALSVVYAIGRADGL